jgi:GNAT superfamily N-acetyltransferase
MPSNAYTGNAPGGGYDSSPRSCWSQARTQAMATGASVRKAALADALGWPRRWPQPSRTTRSSPGSSLTSTAAALSCRPSWSSACASWPSPRPGLEDRRRGGGRGLAPAARALAAVPLPAAAAAGCPGPVPWPADRLGVGVGWSAWRRAIPRIGSHWYLFILGTEPAAQGQGLGSALLAQVLARVDADGMPATWSHRASGTSPGTAAMALR